VRHRQPGYGRSVWDECCFDPSTLGVASLVAALAGTAVGTVGTISSAQAQSANAAYQAQISANNTTIANQNARYAMEAGNAKEQQTAIQERQTQGEVTAALAANGLDVNAGTPEDVRKTTRESGQLTEQQVIDNAALQAYGYRTTATNFAAESGLQTAESGQAATAGNIAAAGGILAGASGVGLDYAKLYQAGAFGTANGYPTLPAAYNPELNGAAPAGGLT
jgi:hypothetical protein